jgi:endonuclease/exonuclease/phosphatase family metal-dependent hydrolase
MPASMHWLVVGDFNLYRHPDDRNRLGADHSEMFLFNESISKLGLIELQLRGQRFTWSNKQHSPLLERLGWFFTSASWTLEYPSTEVFTRTMETSDHVPCLIEFQLLLPGLMSFALKTIG